MLCARPWPRMSSQSAHAGRLLPRTDTAARGRNRSPWRGVQRQSRWMSYCLIQECSQGVSIASPECSRRLVGLSIDYTGSGAFGGVTQTGFPVRSASLLSRPDLALPQPRRVAEGIGRSRATRSHAQRALSREHGEDGEHRTFPEVSTVAHSCRSRIGRRRIHCEA